MTDSDRWQQFLNIAADVDASFTRDPDFPTAEPFMEPGVRVLEDMTGSHAETSEKLVALFTHGKIDPDFLEYVFHALRWPEFGREIRAALAAKPSERLRFLLQRSLGALEDDWDCADIYKRWT